MESIATKKQLTEAALKRKARHRRKQKMKKRAKQRFIEPIDSRNFKVWGGRDTHIVSIVMGQVICSCDGFKVSRDDLCCHVMLYRLVYGDLKK